MSKHAQNIFAAIAAILMTAALLVLTVQAIDADGKMTEEKVKRHLAGWEQRL